MQRYGSDCSVSISIGSRFECINTDLIPQMINDYKLMYIKNKEWGGGPCNSEWLEKYYKQFNISLSIARNAWKPVVLLNIKTDNFGIIKIGFSIYNKRASLFDWDDMSIDNEYYQKSLNRLHNYISKEVFDKQLVFDDVINFLDLKCDFNYTSIKEDVKK